MDIAGRASRLEADVTEPAGHADVVGRFDAPRILEVLCERPLLGIELLVGEQLQTKDAAGIAEHVRVPGERAFLHAIKHQAVLVGFFRGHRIRVVDEAH